MPIGEWKEGELGRSERFFLFGSSLLRLSLRVQRRANEVGFSMKKYKHLSAEKRAAVMIEKAKSTTA